MPRPTQTDPERANVQLLSMRRRSTRKSLLVFTAATLCAGLAPGQGGGPSLSSVQLDRGIAFLPGTDGLCSASVPDPTHGGGVTLPLFDEPGDGSVWVRGSDYKARFDEHGLQFIPFLGSDAPQNYPVDVSIVSARVGDRELDWNPGVAPLREGSMVLFQRGELDEVFEVREEHIEHMFLIDRRLEGGDLEIQIRAESELEPSVDALGTRFSGPLGGVHYGRATILDAQGTVVPCATISAGSTITIRASEADLERAEYPLTVDPILSTFFVGASGLTRLRPEVSYDYDTNTFLSVFLEVFSAGDNDVVAVQLNGSGGVVPGGTTFIDFTSTTWVSAKVANNNGQNQFMVAGVTTSSANRVTVRTRAAGSTAMGSQVNVLTPPYANGFYMSADIGGDPYPWGTPSYCISAVESTGSPSFPPSFTNVIVRYVCVSPLNTITASGRLDLGDTWPFVCAISKSNGTPWYGNQRWTVVWNDSNGFIRNGQVTASGAAIPSGALLGVFGGTLTTELSVSPIFDEYDYNRRFCVTWHTTGQPWNWVVVCNVFSALTGPRVLDWTGGPTQRFPRVEYDGQRVIVAYEEDATSTDKNVFVSSYWLSGSTLMPVEIRVPAATSALSEATPSITSKRTSGASIRDCMLNWRRVAAPGAPPDGIFGAMYYAP